MDESNARVNWDRILSLLALGIALLSAVFAYQANSLSNRANELAEEANSIALEANEIDRFDVTPDIELSVADWGDAIYECINPETGSTLIYVWKPVELTITNSGGALTSLTDVAADYPSDESWAVLAYEDPEFEEQLRLPVDVPGGASRKLYMLALRLYASGDTSEEAYGALGVPYGQDTNLQWSYEFNNGLSLTSDDPFRGYVAGYDFKDECIYYTNRSP